MEKDKKHLFYLNELSDYKVKSDNPDVRGWEIHDRDGRTIGKVDNLLVNKQTEKGSLSGCGSGFLDHRS